MDAVKLLAAFLAGVAVGALLMVLAAAPKRGGLVLFNDWADSETWRQQP